jgi:hypothetical protein
MSDKPARTEGTTYVPTRVDIPGAVPGALRQGEIGSNEADGTLHVMQADGRVSTLPTARGFNRIETLTESEYAELVANTATISTVLYIVRPDDE